METYELGDSPQKVEKRRLDNGLMLLSHHKPGLEGKVYLELGVNFGSRDEADNDMGTAHFIEHAAFRGTDDFSGVAVLKEIEDLGGEWDAATDHDTTTFGIDIERENVPRALKVLKSVLFEPRFGPRNVEKERAIILQEIADGEHDYDEVLDELFLKTLYELHPLRRPVIGTRATMQGISRDTLAGYHRKFYTPQNMVLCIVGDYAPSDIDDVINLFSDVKTRDTNQRRPILETKQKSTFRELLISDSYWYSYCMGAKLTDGEKIVNTFHPDIYIASLVDYLLVGGDYSKIRRSGRINDKVREKGAKVYYISSSHAAYTDYGYFTINFSREGDTQEVIDIIMKELCRVRNEPIMSDELTSIKRFATNEFKEEIISRTDLSEKLITYELGMGGIAEYATFPNRISRVTEEDILRFAGRWMNLDALTITRIAPRE